MNRFKRAISSFSFNIISAVFVLLLAYSLIVSSIGYASFTSTLKREYRETTYHMTEAATSLIDSSLIDDYLDGKEHEDYQMRYGYLHNYCNYMDVTLIHMFKIDQSDYLTGTNVFNVVNDKEIEAGNYSEWELGFVYGERYTKNYQDCYRKIYNKESNYEVAYRTTNLRGKEPHVTVMVPVKDSSDNVVAILSIQRPMSELISGRRPYMITLAITTAVTLVFVCLVASIYIRHQFVKPIKNVIDESKSFSKDNKKGELSATKKSRILEIRELSTSIDKMEDDMISYIDSLTKATTEQKRIGVELNIAKSIQENSVPNVFPAFPDRTDFDLFATMHPAKEVGGDFYNFLLVDDTHLALVMADVSGKGVPASLFMMVSNILIMERLRSYDSPANALSYVNKRICARNTLNMFVTVWVGIIDLENGNVIACNAGHDNPVVLRKNGRIEVINDVHGVIVGAMDDSEYTDYEFNLGKEDKLFLYTDGVVEATNSNNELFTEARMLETLSKLRTKSPVEILKSMKKSIDSFVGDAPQFDDITMMLFEYKDKD